jgi:hypothetical protein
MAFILTKRGKNINRYLFGYIEVKSTYFTEKEAPSETMTTASYKDNCIQIPLDCLG